MLGNVEDFPCHFEGDIDFVLREHDFNRVHEFISIIAKNNNWNIINLLQHEIEGKYFVVSTLSDIRLKFTMQAIDFCFNYMRQGRIILKNEILLRNRILREINSFQFYTPSNEIAFVYYLIKKIEKENVNQKQFDYLYKLWALDKLNIMIELNNHFKESSVKKISSVFDNNNLSLFSKELVSTLNSELHKKHRRGIVNEFKEFKRKIKRFLRPTGVVIAFLGCDGSGKSSVINYLMNQSKEFEAFRGNKYHHLMPTKNNSVSKSPVVNPHESKERSKILSDFKVIYFLFRYVFGFWTMVYPQKVRSQLVIFDRYFHDILVDPRRYRHNGSVWLTKFVSKIIPKPDLFFVIDAPVEILQARKKEVSYDESKKQRELYLQLQETISNVTIVDNSSDLTMSTFQIKRVIHDYLIKRYNQRYN